MKSIMEARFSTRGAIWSWLCRALAAVLFSASPGASAPTACWKPIFTDEERWRMRAHPVVHIAVDANRYPIEYMRNRKHGGLVSGNLSAISMMTGLTFETVSGTEWGHAYAALASGKVDLLPGVWLELARERSGAGALISSPYLVGRLTALARDNSAMIFALRALEGRRVAVKWCGAVEYFIRHSGVPLDVLTFDAEALALANGEADAALGVDVSILPIVRRQFFGRRYMSGVLADRTVSLAMPTRTDLPILASIIDKALAAIPVKETAAITRDWVELGDYGKPTIRSILHYRAPVVLAIVVTLFTFAMLTYLSWKSRAAAIRRRREKVMFVAFVSHEIRTPMQTILSSLEFLQRSGLAGQQAERADAATFASDTLLTLLDDIREHSRLESRKFTLSPNAVELASWARQTVDMVRWRAERKALALTLDVAGLSGSHVVIDPVRVRQIVLNLLVNAINFTAAGAVTLHVRFLAARQGRNGTLLIEVRDTGVGIAPDRFRHLFDAYWQGDRCSRQGVGGSGLGLAICRELVELMRGTITVDSTPHVETVFTVKLPVTAAEVGPAARHAATAPVPVGTAMSRVRRDAHPDRRRSRGRAGRIGAPMRRTRLCRHRCRHGRGDVATARARAGRYGAVLLQSARYRRLRARADDPSGSGRAQGGAGSDHRDFGGVRRCTPGALPRKRDGRRAWQAAEVRSTYKRIPLQQCKA